MTAGILVFLGSLPFVLWRKRHQLTEYHIILVALAVLNCVLLLIIKVVVG